MEPKTVSRVDYPVGRIDTITPDEAQRLLDTRPLLMGGTKIYRRARKRRVEYFIQIIKRGEWNPKNGETIKISKNGCLIDGQHRLMACVATGIPLKCFMVVGVEDDAYLTIDDTERRTFADNLGFENDKNARLVQSVVIWLSRYDSRAIVSTRQMTSLSGLEILRANPGIPESVEFCRKQKGLANIFAMSLACFCHYIFARNDKDDADEFIESLASGVALAGDDPILILRNRLLQDKGSKLKMSHYDKLALTIKAWNYYREGVQCKSLRWRRSGPMREPFPVAQ